MTKKQVIIGIIILLVVGVAGFLGYKLYLSRRKGSEVLKVNEFPMVPLSGCPGGTVPQNGGINGSITCAPVEYPAVEEPKPQVLPQANFEVKKIDFDKSKIQLIHDALAN